MKLIVQGHIIVQGQKADFSSAYDSPLSLINKKTTTAIQDVCFVVNEATAYVVSLVLARGETRDLINLRVGENVAYTHKGNAYEYLLSFGLEGE